MLKTINNLAPVIVIALTVALIYSIIVDPAATAIEQGFWTAQQLTVVSQ